MGQTMTGQDLFVPISTAILPGGNDTGNVLFERLHGVDFNIVFTERVGLEMIRAFAHLAVPSRMLPPDYFRYGCVHTYPEDIEGR